MPHNRYFSPDLSTTLTGDEHRHLFKVMRGIPGTEIELIDGKGTLAIAKIEAIDKKSAELTITSKTTQDPLPEKTLGISLIKQPKLELVIEKGTELGITNFILFPADKSERNDLSENHLHRLHQITIAATKQSGRLYLPQITLQKSLQIPPNAAYASLETKTTTTNSNTILIGPESGWSSQEEKLLASQSESILLNHNTLRAETAAISAASYLTHPQ